MRAMLFLKVLRGLVRGETEKILLEVIDYLMAESRILREKYELDCGKRLLLSDEQRRELAEKGKAIIGYGYSHVIQIVKPDTLMRWYRQLIARKFDGSAQRRKPGRPETPSHVCKLVLRFARENPTWGYDRIAGAVQNLGHTISDTTVANILNRHGIVPAPERGKTGTWKQFLDRHLDVMWATEFFTVEVLSWKGLVTYYVLFFIHLESRKVVPGGLTPNPDSAWMQQVARNVTGFDGELVDARFLIHDQDKLFRPFDPVLPDTIEVVRLPHHSPNLNAFAERFVKSIKSEALKHFIPFSERGLRHIIREYLAHYHTERNHQGIGIDNRLLFADERVDPGRTGEVTKSSRLGGVLSFYFRAA